MTGAGRLLDLYDPKTLDLGKWGRLRVADREHLVLVRSGVEVPVPSDGLLQDSTAMIGWFVDEIGKAILTTSTGQVLGRLDLTSDEFASVAELKRYADQDLRFISFHEADDSVICLYERGLVCFDNELEIMWHVAHEDISAQYLGTRDGLIWLRRQWPPGHEDDNLVFRISDGEKID